MCTQSQTTARKKRAKRTQAHRDRQIDTQTDTETELEADIDAHLHSFALSFGCSLLSLLFCGLVFRFRPLLAVSVLCLCCGVSQRMDESSTTASTVFIKQMGPVTCCFEKTHKCKGCTTLLNVATQKQSTQTHTQKKEVYWDEVAGAAAVVDVVEAGACGAGRAVGVKGCWDGGRGLRSGSLLPAPRGAIACALPRTAAG